MIDLVYGGKYDDFIELPIVDDFDYKYLLLMINIINTHNNKHAYIHIRKYSSHSSFLMNGDGGWEGRVSKRCHPIKMYLYLYICDRSEIKFLH